MIELNKVYNRDCMDGMREMLRGGGGGESRFNVN